MLNPPAPPPTRSEMVTIFVVFWLGGLVWSSFFLLPNPSPSQRLKIKKEVCEQLLVAKESYVTHSVNSAKVAARESKTFGPEFKCDWIVIGRPNATITLRFHKIMTETEATTETAEDITEKESLTLSTMENDINREEKTFLEIFHSNSTQEQEDKYSQDSVPFEVKFLSDAVLIRILMQNGPEKKSNVVMEYEIH